MFYVVVGLTVLMMSLNISPFAFVDIEYAGDSLVPVPGPGLIPFSIISTLFSALAVYFLIRKYMRLEGLPKKQVRLVLSGILIMLALIIATILVPIALYSSLAFLPFTPIYVLVFLGLTAYAITKYQLFNIKVLVAEALTLVIGIVLFAKMFGEETRNAQIIDGLVLLCVIIVGYFLVRSVRREVEQRELIEKQEKELEMANKQQESLLHFISHEIKGYLTESQAGFAAIVEGDYGAVPDKLNEMARNALSGVRKGVATVMDILDASNLKKGTVSYKQESFDLRNAVREVVDDLKKSVDEKHLTIELSLGEGTFTFIGDEEKIRRHVIRNLIDNAIKYTPHGSVHVTLTDGDKIRLAVKDSGVGITSDDMRRLFTEGGHGKESIKVNVHSTGYGLFIAKQVVEAHGGRIWAESEGQDKGSTFIIEFPLLRSSFAQGYERTQ
jgi:signal transduction histidine kinase